MLTFVFSVVVVLCARKQFKRKLSQGDPDPATEPEDPEPLYKIFDLPANGGRLQFVIYSDWGLYTVDGELVVAVDTDAEGKQFWAVLGVNYYTNAESTQVVDENGVAVYDIVPIEHDSKDNNNNPERGNESRIVRFPVLYIGNDVYSEIEGDDFTFAIRLSDARKYFDRLEEIPSETEKKEMLSKAVFIIEDDELNEGNSLVYTAQISGGSITKAGKPSYIIISEGEKGSIVAETDAEGNPVLGEDGEPVVVGGLGVYDVDTGILIGFDGKVVELKENSAFIQPVPILVLLLVLALLS